MENTLRCTLCEKDVPSQKVELKKHMDYHLSKGEEVTGMQLEPDSLSSEETVSEDYWSFGEICQHYGLKEEDFVHCKLCGEFVEDTDVARRDHLETHNGHARHFSRDEVFDFFSVNEDFDSVE